jgi:hypothetical protein
MMLRAASRAPARPSSSSAKARLPASRRRRAARGVGRTRPQRRVARLVAVDDLDGLHPTGALAASAAASVPLAWTGGISHIGIRHPTARGPNARKLR